MEIGGPYRSASKPKPEQIVEFYDDVDANDGEVIKSCVEKANEWLKERVGTIDIILREVTKYKGYFRGILIWYREHG